MIKGRKRFWYVKYLICLFLIADICFLWIMIKTRQRSMDTTPPEITCPTADAEYTPGEDVSVLLSGVTATDPEDGDVTESVRVRGIHIASDNSHAIVTYVARDQANNIGLSQKIRDGETC